jgi:hypothetical protein
LFDWTLLLISLLPIGRIYSVTCTYTLPGRYRISVKVSGQHIAGSPYTVDVHSVRNYRTVRTLARYLTSPSDSGMYRLPSGIGPIRKVLCDRCLEEHVLKYRTGEIRECFN